MMESSIVCGQRAYGRVEMQDGEYAETVFWHIATLPLVPHYSRWITYDPTPGKQYGFQIELLRRSIVAAYLRIWAPGLAAVLVVASGSVIAIASSVVLAALSVWSWTWRARRGALARQRGDFDRLALGSRCDPAWMTADVRERLENQLTAQLARHIGARSLDDVVQRGATNLAEALPSYGLLRLRSLRSREAAEAAGRLLANTADKLPCDGGPYRTHLVGGVPALPEAISAAAKAQTDAMRRRTHGAAGIRSHARP